MSPRPEARTCPRNSISPARRPAEKFLIRPVRVERDVYGRPLPTCDLVKATSLLVSVLLPHNVNRLWDRAGAQFLQTLAAAEPCSAENRLSFSTERDRFSITDLVERKGLHRAPRTRRAIHPRREPLLRWAVCLVYFPDVFNFARAYCRLIRAFS